MPGTGRRPGRAGTGYMDAPGAIWPAPKGRVDRLLVEQHGGFIPGARIRLADGRPAAVYAAEWSEAGSPVAYRVRELIPGTHGNVGRLVPSITSDIFVKADDCTPLVEWSETGAQ